MSRKHLSIPRRRRWPIALVLLALVAVGIARLGWELRPPTVQTQHVELVRVADGDTVVVSDSNGRDIRVRLIGVDAPELGTSASFRCALYVAEMLESARELRLEPDPHTPHDRYGRVLGWLWVETADRRQLLLNEELIRSGHAELFRDTSKQAKYYHRLTR